jgi:proteasome lid subunit RPN8/RPN11
MGIRLGEKHIEEIKRHGEQAYPEECGGLLLGMLEDGIRVVREVLPLANVRRDSRHNRVELNPLDYARAEREASGRGLGVWGYYHSHPNQRAVPSSFDLEHAPFVEWSYLIVSVREGKPEEVRAWTLRDDRSQFDEELLEITEEDARKL